MTDFSKVLEQAKNMQNKMKETQESIKKLRSKVLLEEDKLKFI